MDAKSVLEKIRKFQKQGINNILLKLDDRNILIDIRNRLGDLKRIIPKAKNSIWFEKGYILNADSVKKIWGLVE